MIVYVLLDRTRSKNRLVGVYAQREDAETVKQTHSLPWQEQLDIIESEVFDPCE